MKSERFIKIVEEIDKVNSQDPTLELIEGKELPAALIYGKRMSSTLESFAPDSTELLHVAARGQHIKRWSIARNSYPMDRKGYLQWRTELKGMHAQLMTNLMTCNEYTSSETERVHDLIMKKKLKQDEEVQALEDVICLVFLHYYFDDFISKHLSQEEKVISILQKTWRKMSEKGHSAALKLEYSDKGLSLVKTALGLN